MRHDPTSDILMPRRLAKHWKAQLLILVSALILAVFLSLLATTPTYYRHVSLAAHDAVADIRANANAARTAPAMASFDLRTPSLLDGIAGVTQLLLDPDIMALRVTALGTIRRIGSHGEGRRIP